jgi:hypothetical protein
MEPATDAVGDRGDVRAASSTSRVGSRGGRVKRGVVVAGFGGEARRVSMAAATLPLDEVGLGRLPVSR